ncbi:MAG: electron transport complex subunit RsxB [Gammaproteobacteria bacterium]
MALVCWALVRLGLQLRNACKRKISIVDIINAELPQTQCGQCGFAGCLPYARAISQGEAINKCPPGGTSTIRRLSILLNEIDEPLDPAHGLLARPKVAVIREDECIGCTKCIQACPVDAIVGAAKLMHTVIEDECTGCDLCVAPCPVDCIDMVHADSRPISWLHPQPTDSWRRLIGSEPAEC